MKIRITHTVLIICFISSFLPVSAGTFDYPVNINKVFLQQHDIEGNRVFNEQRLQSLLTEYVASNDSTNIFFCYLGLSLASTTDKSEMINYIIKAYPYITQVDVLTPYLKLNEAISYYYLGKYRDALKRILNLKTAFTAAEEAPMAFVVQYYNILCYAALGEHENAVKLLSDLSNRLDNIVEIDDEIINLLHLHEINIEGLVHIFHGDNDQAADSFIRGIEMARKYNEGRMLMNFYGNLSNIYLFRGSYQQAIDYARIEAKYCTQQGDKRSLFALSGIIAQSFNGLGEKDSTAKYVEKIIELMPVSYDSYFIKSNQKFLLDYFYESNQYQKLINITHYMGHVQDSLNQIRIERDYELIRSQIDLEGAQEQIDQLKKINALENQKTEAAMKFTIALIIGMLGILLLVYFIYKNLIEKKNQNIVLERKNAEINGKNEELITQQEDIVNQAKRISELNALLEQKVDDRTKEILIKNKKLSDYAFYNSHNIRGPLARIIGIIQLWESGFITLDEKEEMLQNIQKSAKELDEMVRKVNRMLE